MGSNWNWNKYQSTYFSGRHKNPVSLKQITGKNYNPVELAKEFCFIHSIKILTLLLPKVLILFTIHTSPFFTKKMNRLN